MLLLLYYILNIVLICCARLNQSSRRNWFTLAKNDGRKLLVESKSEGTPIKQEEKDKGIKSAKA